MVCNDKIYAVVFDLDDFGDKIETDSVEIGCRVVPCKAAIDNLNSSSSSKYEIKVFVPFRRSIPDLMSGDFVRFKHEGRVFDAIVKMLIKDFYNKPKHFELSLVEDTSV